MVRPASAERNPPVECGAEALHLAAAGQRAPERDLVRVLQVAADRQAAGQPRHSHASAQAVGEVGRSRLARHVRIRGEHNLLHAVPLDPSDQLVDAQVLGVDAVDRGERAAEDVVEAAELARPLDREEVDWLLHHADERVVASRVPADRARLFLCEIAALVAEADPLLDVLDRGGERERFVLWALEQVERKPVGRARPDAGKARELRDQVFHSGGEHVSYSADMARSTPARSYRFAQDFGYGRFAAGRARACATATAVRSNSRRRAKAQMPEFERATPRFRSD